MASIAIEHLTKRYPSGTTALDDANLDIADGEFVAIVGPSGCGKSTLLRILAGLDTATEGHAAVEGAAPAASALPSATVFQEASLFPWMRVGENVAFAFDSLGVPRADIQRRVADVLALVGLGDYARAWPHELSGGMKQRAAVARAFVTDPPVLFMDEPFGALDEQTRVGLANELMRLWERSPKTVVFVTHGIEEAVTLADRVVVMSARPGTIKAVIPVPFPRPRDAVAIRAEPGFGELVVRIWDLLR
ncbi:ABC transporter ATP-binding protein [Vulcanimicrobium alpinum]|uniref:ABC transporter ATP-binding protein n=1 Tax=Vulcanimicrobium alpinum TaxID=3016050 RepID=UPI00295ED411|nr:ABC transporter ATP-binding protein [Vulcanimicrobium alpinum]